MASNAAPSNYWNQLTTSFGAGWTRFWFVPSDPLTLSALRLLVGCLALYTVATYGFDLDRFFGPQGMLPLSTVQALQGDASYRLSVLDLARTPGELWGIHSACLVILAAFAAGIYARVSSVLALVVVLSYIQRGPMLTGQFEPILAFVTFYLCLGPCGAELSVDRWLRPLGRKSREPAGMAQRSVAATIAVRLIQIHLAAVYLMMALGKLQEAVWWDGTATWWLAIDTQAALVDLSSLHPFVINAWTHVLVVYELVFPVLIWQPLARPLMLWLGAVLWVLTGLVTGLAAFALMMVIAGLAFVPPSTLRRYCRSSG